MVSEKKTRLVKELTKLSNEYPVVALVNFESLPAQQLQKMKATLLKKGVKIIMTRKKLIKRILEGASKQDLIEHLKGMPALLFSNENPFTLYAILQKSKSEAPAKAGQVAPKDIEVKAGMTNFAPGPIISELAAVGIKTKVTNGKLEIMQDTIVAKEGDKITAKLAETLKRLDIKPMEIGLDLVAAWESGFIFKAKDLRIDEGEYTDNFTKAAQWALNLAVEVAYPTTDTAEILVQKAFREAKGVALEANIISPDTADEILAKSERQALSVKSEAKL